MIIDARCRPPTKEFQAVFKGPALSYIMSRSGRFPDPASHVEGSVELYFKEMEAANITTAVAVGRVLPGRAGAVSNDHIAELCRAYPGRIVGVGGVDPTGQVHDPRAEVERCITGLGLKGVIIEPGATAKPVAFDDASLDPIYDACARLNAPVFLLTGPFSGPTLSHTHPSSIENVAQKFRKLSIVCAHGCWPYVTEALGVAVRCRNVFISPDIYIFRGGGDAYVQELQHRSLQDQFLFATAYPLAPMQEYVEAFLRLPISEAVMEKVLYKNAQRVLSLA
ncbi:MAG: amidohydrolase family protein [Burkholderiales bacterium]|nr:amidohydrolase family protein [Burkholderiales bacterium]